MLWGAIRGICANGMVFGTVLGKFYAKHTKGFRIGNLKDSLTATYDQIPAIQNRIKQLESSQVTQELKNLVEKGVGKKLSKTVFEQRPLTQWQMYNGLTNYIIHVMEQRHRSRYQQAISRIFAL